MRSFVAALALITMLGGCAAPGPAASDVPATSPARGHGDELLALVDLPHGWMLTRETIDNAAEMAASAEEAESLVARGFIAHHQREFQNRYGGGARELVVSVSWYGASAGASAGVAENAAQLLTRAESLADPVQVFAFDLKGVDELRAFQIDRGPQELVYLAFFRVGGASAAVLVNGYKWDTGPELLVTVAKEQVRRISEAAPTSGPTL
jgi:hypothetical protein